MLIPLSLFFLVGAIGPSAPCVSLNFRPMTRRYLAMGAHHPYQRRLMGT
jgi:hypothetical protein